MIKDRTWLVLLSIVLFTVLLRAQETKPTLRFEGSTSISKFIKDADAAYNQVQFRINTSGKSDEGENAILRGLADIAGITRPCIAGGVNGEHPYVALAPFTTVS